MQATIASQIAYKIGFAIEHCDAFLISCGNPYSPLMVHIHTPYYVFWYSRKRFSNLRDWREFVYAIGAHHPSIFLCVVHYLAHIREFISSYGHLPALPH